MVPELLARFMLRFFMREIGVVHVSQLVKRGVSRSSLYDAVEAGTLMRLRRGWYATPRAAVDVILAVRQGVRVTCVSAAKYYDLWVPLHSNLHVFAAHGRTSDLSASGVTLHPRPHLGRWPDNNPIAPLELMLHHASLCLPVPDAAILLESAVNLKKVTLDDARAIVDQLPHHRRLALSRIGSAAQSGTETKVRWFLESRHVQVQAQPLIEGVGHVDLLIGESLVIECDSVRYHTDPAQYREDHRRDIELTRLGYRTIRLTWEDVCLNWEATKERLLGILATRRHRYRRPN